MNPLLFPAIIFGSLILLVLATKLVDRLRRTRLESHVTRVERDVATFNEKLKQDPQRAGIDMGKRYAVNEMEATLQRLRREEER